MIRLQSRALLVWTVLAVQWLEICNASMTPNTSSSYLEENERRRWGSGVREAELNREGEDVVWQDYFFMVFRFVIFIFIICFPFVRGGRVWYQAGGRIVIRRREDRSIIGLQIIRPDMERWLILSGYNPRHPVAAAPSASQKLTHDEVYALPEIKAPKACEVESLGCVDIELGLGGSKEDEDDDDELAVVHHGKTNLEYDDIESDLKKESTPQSKKSEEDTMGSTAEHTEVSSDAASESIPEESKEDAKADSAKARPLFTTTMSTSCSICIEDFEKGETIRLLPRCGHAFHTECILPWLTERQGCCPCCKEDVIERPLPENNPQLARDIAIGHRPRNPHRVYMG